MVLLSLLPAVVFSVNCRVLAKGTLFRACPLVIQYQKNTFSTGSFSSTPKNMSDPRVSRLEKNAEIAENLIAEIYSKLSDLEAESKVVGSVLASPDLVKLREENEALRLEVAKWKELLIIREIRNGRNPIVRIPGNVGRDANSYAHVKKSQSVAVVSKNGQVPSKKSTASIPDSKSFTAPSNKASKTSTNNNNASPARPSTGTTRSKSPSSRPATAATANADQGKKEVKKEVKPKEAKDQGAGAPGEEVDVSKLDFRIGLIRECDRHPDADALYVEKIDLGEDKPRTIISGLVKHVPIEEMRNRLVVVLANLKPAKMRGILSEGMVMCASSPEKVEILIPPPGSAPGDLVHIEGYGRNPEAIMNPKKKIFETVQPDLKTNEKKEATYKGHLWVVPGKGTVLTASLVNTMIK